MCTFFQFETTVITGFEAISARECRKVLSQEPEIRKGRLKFQAPADGIIKENLDRLLESMTDTIEWNYYNKIYNGLKQIINQNCPHYNMYVIPMREDIDSSQNDIKQTLKFRVSCNRNGENHNFQSNEAACIFGGHINDKLQWKADMTKHDLEVILNINQDLVEVCLPLTNKCLSDRNISHFGPTTLKSTICHHMLQIAQPSPGEIICDPLCGGASIPIEGSLCWPQCLYVCGDSHEKALLRTRLNMEHLGAKLGEPAGPPSPHGPSTFNNILPLMWDATRLPLRDNLVDVFVTDAPFGKRIGTRNMNRSLYPKVLAEMARVCRYSTGQGRAVILTKDVTAMSLALKRTKDYWKMVRFFHVNIGGLKGTLYLIHRTDTPYLVKEHIDNKSDVVTEDSPINDLNGPIDADLP